MLMKEKIYKCQWKVCYKLNQEFFQKTDIGGESQDICQELENCINNYMYGNQFDIVIFLRHKLLFISSCL